MEAAALEPITMHKCRHTYASTMIAAGAIPARSCAGWVTQQSRSRSTATRTLCVGSEAETAEKLQAFLNRAVG
jgi:benzoyl-CoA reductase/2-hydroxyglutaryl-CoA dehydratase subunit BcrC/BadD/HgdB